MSGWYYKREHEAVGIYSDDEILNMAARGALLWDTPVMHERKTRGEWVPASELVALRQRIEAAAANRPGPAVGDTVEGPPAWRRRLLSVLALPVRQAQQAWEGGVHRFERGLVLVGRRSARTVALHVCDECDREFARYDTPGRCPLCGEWARMECRICGYASAAKPFVENKCRCPKCGTKTAVPGVASVPWAISGLFVILVLVVVLVILAS